MERPTWLLDIDSTSYHAATKRNEFTTSHRLDLFRRCPALYKKTIDGDIVEGDSAAFMLGRATHTRILEGAEKFAAEYIVSDGPVNEKTGKPYGKLTKAYADWAEHQERPVITTEDFALMEAMNAAVHAHKIAADLLSSGIAEGTIRTSWDDEPVQCRMDWFDPERNIIVDLKTCNDTDRFGYDIRDYNYVGQLAFYAHCVSLTRGDKIGVGPQIPNCYLIAVEKKEPFRVSVTEVCNLTLYDAIHYCDAMIEELKQCRATNEWPTRYEKLIII